MLFEELSKMLRQAVFALSLLRDLFLKIKTAKVLHYTMCIDKVKSIDIFSDGIQGVRTGSREPVLGMSR